MPKKFNQAVKSLSSKRVRDGVKMADNFVKDKIDLQNNHSKDAWSLMKKQKEGV